MTQDIVEALANIVAIIFFLIGLYYIGEPGIPATISYVFFGMASVILVYLNCTGNP